MTACFKLILPNRETMSQHLEQLRLAQLQLNGMTADHHTFTLHLNTYEGREARPIEQVTKDPCLSLQTSRHAYRFPLSEHNIKYHVSPDRFKTQEIGEVWYGIKGSIKLN